ncbi:MAG: outer membrane protein transport protein [Deltaproteobacteria bacterium]|nr:outer membrane protein transport protein [Deltaproteobacteria bacterium]
MPIAAHAAGWWNIDKGTASFGQGAASLADPRDPTAIMHNPAGLAGVKGLAVVVDADWIFDARTFARASDDPIGSGTLTRYTSVANGWTPTLPSPALFASYNLERLGLGGLTVGGGVYGPPRVDHVWPKEGAQRYSEVEYHALQMSMTLGAAYELPWYQLRLGVAGMLIRETVDAGLNISGVFPPLAQPEDPSYDAYVHVRAVDPWIPCGIVGISGALSPALTIAASYQLPFDVHASGKADQIALASGLARLASVRGDQIDARMKLAAVITVAATYRALKERLALSLAFVHEGWHRNDTILFQPKDIVMSDVSRGDTTLQEIKITSHWQDTFSVRGGAQYQLLPDLLALRLGGFYEKGAVPEEYLSAFSLDLDKVGATLGARLDLPLGIFVDVAAGYLYWLPVTVTNTNIKIVNPLTLPPSEQWPIANGDYSNHQVLAMLAVGVALGAAPAAAPLAVGGPNCCRERD